MHHSHTGTVLTFPTSTFSFTSKQFCLKMVWLQERLITFCHYAEDQAKHSLCSGLHALFVTVNAFLSWTTHFWDSRTIWGFALLLEWLRLWWTLYFTIASRTRHLRPLTKFFVNVKECKLTSAVSHSAFFRNNVQAFPASDLNGRSFAKYRLLPQPWFWESTFVCNREQQSRTFSSVGLIVVSPGKWTRRAFFFSQVLHI